MNRTKAGGTTQQQWQFHQSLQADRNKTFLCPLWTGKMWEPRLEYFSTNSNLNDSFTFVAHFKNSCTIVTLSYLIQLFQIDAGVRRSSPKWPEPERIFQCFENIQPVVPQFFSVKPRWRELSDSHEKDKFLVMSKSWHFLLQPLITVWETLGEPPGAVGFVKRPSMYDKILFKNNTADLSRRLYFTSFVLSPGTFNKSFNMKTPSTAIINICAVAPTSPARVNLKTL